MTDKTEQPEAKPPGPPHIARVLQEVELKSPARPVEPHLVGELCRLVTTESELEQQLSWALRVRDFLSRLDAIEKTSADLERQLKREGLTEAERLALQTTEAELKSGLADLVSRYRDVVEYYGADM